MEPRIDTALSDIPTVESARPADSTNFGGRLQFKVGGMTPTAGSFISGILVGNSMPHLASIVTGRHHLTPLAGRGSGPGLNGIWGMLNLVGGFWLLRLQGGPSNWDGRLPAFETGVLVIATWMAVTERIFGTNTRT